MADHERHARRIAAEVYRCQVGVADTQAYIFQIDAQDLGDHNGKYAVRALSDFSLAAKDRNVAAAIQFNLDARLRHVIPINGQAGTRHVSAACQPKSMAFRQLPVTLFPAASPDDGLDTLFQSNRPDLQPVCRDRIRFQEVPQAQLCRVDSQSVSRLVQLNLEAESRLRRSMTSLGSARRFVGKSACALEPVIRQFIGRRLQCTRVVSAGHAITAVCATIECRSQMLRGHRAVFLESGLQMHLHRMAAAVAVEHFLPGQRDLGGPAQLERQFGNHDFMIKRIALATECATVRTGYYPDARSWYVERLGQGTMHVMRTLRR